MSGALLIAAKILICLGFLDRPVSGSVATCSDSMVLPYVSRSSMVCTHLTGDIVGVSLLAKCMLAPGFAIAKLLLKGELVGVSIF